MKRLNIIILLSIISLLFQSSISPSIIINRSLEKTKVSKEKSCSKTPKNYKGITLFDSLNDYVNSLKIEDKGGEVLFINIIINGSTDGLIEFLHAITFYIIMLVFSFVAFVTWTFMWSCCCCNCCIFNTEKKAGCYATINLVLSFGFTALIFVSAIVALSQSRYAYYIIIDSSYEKSFNGAVCSLMNFIDSATYGEDTEEIPRWEGAQGISDSMTTLMNTIKEIQSNYVGMIIPSTELKNAKTAYQDKESSLQATYKITDPSQKTDKVIPLYAKEFENLYASSSYIGKINAEKNSYITLPIQILNDLDSLIKTTTTSSVTFQNDIGKIQALLDEFQLLFNEISETVIDNISLFQSIAINMLLLSFKIVYALFIVLSISSVATFLVYILCKLFFLRFVLHFFWNIIFILTILSFIIGSIAGSFSIISKQMIPVIHQVLSLEYLMDSESPFQAKDSAKYLDTCLNKDGDLINSMNIDPTTGSAKQFDNYIKYSILITQTKPLIDKNMNSNAIPPIITEMEKYRLDINSSLSSYQTVLDSINKDLATCGKTERFYVSGQTHESSWIEITSLGALPSITCSPDSFTIMQDRLTSIQQSVKENHANIDKIISTLNTMKTDYNSLMILLKRDMNQADIYTSPLSVSHSDRIGTSSFFSLFNCGSIKYDLMNFIDLFGNKNSKASKTIAICSLFCSFASFIGVFFLMNTIYYYTKNARKEELEAKGEELQLQTDKNIPQTYQLRTNPIKYSTVETL